MNKTALIAGFTLNETQWDFVSGSLSLVAPMGSIERLLPGWNDGRKKKIYFNSLQSGKIEERYLE